MRQRNRLGAPALVLSVIALFVALGGSVYAAKAVKKIDGKLIKVKSIPGNRLKPRSITAKQLSLGVILTGESTQITGSQIKESTLGQVPSAFHADTADTARSAIDAQTALAAVSAITAEKINGYSAGCGSGTIPFGGACWETSTNTATTAPNAAELCAIKGGTLPGALELAAFAKGSGTNVDASGEWSSDLSNFSGENSYAVAIVSDQGAINTAFPTASKKYRCVIPLVK